MRWSERALAPGAVIGNWLSNALHFHVNKQTSNVHDVWCTTSCLFAHLQSALCIFITTRQCCVCLLQLLFRHSMPWFPRWIQSQVENCISSECNNGNHHDENVSFYWCCSINCAYEHTCNKFHFISLHHQKSNKAIALQLQLHLLHARACHHHQQCDFSSGFTSSSIAWGA